jgi:hypothetical protein
MDSCSVAMDWDAAEARLHMSVEAQLILGKYRLEPKLRKKWSGKKDDSMRSCRTPLVYPKRVPQ